MGLAAKTEDVIMGIFTFFGYWLSGYVFISEIIY